MRVVRAVRRNRGCDRPVEDVVVTHRVQRAIDWAWRHGGCRDVRRIPCGDVFRCDAGSSDLRGFWQICSPSTLGPGVCARGASASEELDIEWSVAGATRRRTFGWGEALDLSAA